MVKLTFVMMAVSEGCRRIVSPPSTPPRQITSEYWKGRALKWTWETLGNATYEEASKLKLTECCEATMIYGRSKTTSSMCFFWTKDVNPLAYGFFASRPFGGGARGLVNQWARVAYFAKLKYNGSWTGKERCDERCVREYHHQRPYPYSISGLPFLAGFDAMVTEVPVTKDPWGKLSSAPVLFAQDPAPELIYTTNTAAALKRCLTDVIRPAERYFGGKKKVVVYIASQSLHTMDSDVRGTKDVMGILNSRVVAAVFAVNAAFHHPKLRGSPMGFHSGHAVLRGTDLISIAAASKPWTHRLQRVHACFNSGYADRRAAKTFVEDSCHLCTWCGIPDPSPNPHFNQIEYWRDVSRYQYAISPWGNGKECGRSYELLALGVVPIMHRYPGLTANAYEGLPVVIVNEWSEITPTNLAAWSQRLSDSFFSKKKFFDRIPIDLVSVASQHRRMRSEIVS